MHAEREYFFRSGAVRDAAYELQLPARRSELHLWAADALEELLGEEAAGAVADHLALARELSDDQRHLDREKQQLRLAARRAKAQYNEAESWRRQLRVASLSSGTERLNAIHSAASAATSASLSGEAERLYLELLAEESDPGFRELGVRGLANLYVDLGRLREAAEILDRSSGAFPEADLTMARLLSVTSKPHEAERAYLRVAEVARRAGDSRTEASALGGLSALLINTGRTVEGEEILQRARALAEGSNDLRMQGFWTGSLGVRRAVAGRLDDAAALYVSARKIARETGDRRSECMWLSYLATNLMERGDHQGSEKLFEQAIELSREIADIARESLSAGNLSILRREQGDLERAARLLDRALELDRRGGSKQFEGAHLCEYALLHLMRGDEAAARRDWQKGKRLLEQLGDIETLESCRQQMRTSAEAESLIPLE